MPTDAQSFVVLYYLPNWLSEPMTIDMLALASPAARPTSTVEPTTTHKSMSSAMDQNEAEKFPLVTAILVPLLLLALTIGSAIWYVRYRRRKRARSLANNLPPVDPEQAVRRWPETTFSTAIQPQYQRVQSSMLPLMTETGSTARNSHPLRRALSESDLGQFANPGPKAADLQCVATQTDRAELEAQTAPLVRC